MKYLLGINFSKSTPSKRTVIQNLLCSTKQVLSYSEESEYFSFWSTESQKHLSPLAMLRIKNVMNENLRVK